MTCGFGSQRLIWHGACIYGWCRSWILPAPALMRWAMRRATGTILTFLTALILALYASGIAQAQPEPDPSQDQSQGDPTQVQPDTQPDTYPDTAPDQNQAQVPDKAAPGMARVSLVQGDVSTQRGDSGDWLVASLNTPMAPGDKISTGN